MSQQKSISLHYAAENLSRQLQLIERASNVGSALTKEPDNLTLESWLKQHEVYSTNISPVDSRLANFSVIEVQSQFLDCATVIYTMRVGLPIHPDYQQFAADPQVRKTLNRVSRVCPSNTSFNPSLCLFIHHHLTVTISFKINHIFQSIDRQMVF